MSDAASSPSSFLVACLCAAWCRTCDAYRDTLSAVRDTLQAERPLVALRFVWVDIEDEAELVGDLDIEDFPTILIALGDQVLFFGTVMPHAATLQRIVQNTLDNPPVASTTLPADVRALPARLASHAPL